MNVTVTNASQTDYQISGSQGCIARVEVHDSKGDIVPNAAFRICDMVAVQHGIGPAGTLSDRLSIVGLSAGTYRVRVSVSVVNYGALESDQYTVSVR